MVQEKRIFFSCADANKDKCAKIVKQLRERYAHVHFYLDVFSGGMIHESILQELIKSDVFVVALSKEAFQSRWVVAEIFWAYGFYYQHDVTTNMIFFTLEQFDPTEHFEGQVTELFSSMQRIEAKPGVPLADEEMWEQLIRALDSRVLLNQTEIEIMQAKLYRLQTDYDLSVESAYHARTQDKPKEAIGILNGITVNHPEKFEGWFELARAHYALAHFIEAEQAFQRAAACAGKDSLVPAQLWALAYEGWGMCALHLGRDEDAIKAFKQATDKWKSLTSAWQHLVEVEFFGHYNPHKMQKFREKAIDHLNNEIAANPDNVEGLVLKGDILAYLGLASDAALAYDAALKLDDHHRQAQEGLAMAYKAMGQYEEAIKAFEELLSHTEGRK